MRVLEHASSRIAPLERLETRLDAYLCEAYATCTCTVGRARGVHGDGARNPHACSMIMNNMFEREFERARAPAGRVVYVHVVLVHMHMHVLVTRPADHAHVSCECEREKLELDVHVHMYTCTCVCL